MMCFNYKAVSFGGSSDSLCPQSAGVKEKIILLVWLRNPKSSSEQSTGNVTATTTGYSRVWGLLENGALQATINTQNHPRIRIRIFPRSPGGQRKLRMCILSISLHLLFYHLLLLLFVLLQRNI